MAGRRCSQSTGDSFRCMRLLLAALCLLLVFVYSESFQAYQRTEILLNKRHTRTSRLTTSSSELFAKKKGKASAKQQSRSTSGFGGAAAEPCPCGSGKGYMKCCGILHNDPNAYAAATAEQVVRARYSAYAKRQIDFIIGSTHPLNKNFISDIQHWKKTIEENCYDNFELTNCEILSESYKGGGDEEVATVQFVAQMTQLDSRERTAFMETSTFERAGKHVRGGAWLYRDGVVETPPDANAAQVAKETS